SVEPKVRRRDLVMRFVPSCSSARVEPGGLLIAEVALRRTEILPVGLHLVAVGFDRGQPRPQVLDARVREELPDDHLRSLVIAFAETAMPDLPFSVDEVERRP